MRSSGASRLRFRCAGWGTHASSARWSRFSRANAPAISRRSRFPWMAAGFDRSSEALPESTDVLRQHDDGELVSDDEVLQIPDSPFAPVEAEREPGHHRWA